jgi:hypothetical protein
MPEPRPQSEPAPSADWESFYASYRKPGYVPGFEITSKLGGGMFGLVFKATKQSIGKDYAIKFLKVDDAQVRNAVLQELDQVQWFAQVDHPNLVSIEDKGEVDGIPFLVMAYAGAETLKSRLPGDAATREETLRLFLQACRGVAALHEKSLVHFDLKPANVFLKGGVARVGDYGLSKLVTHSRGSLSMGRGTPYYMAPEMLARRGDHRSDVYSLGVMLFEVLTGDVPFKGDSEWHVLQQHERAEVTFPAQPQVPERERAIVRRCMHKDPAQRFQSVHDLIAVVGGGELAPTAPTPAAAVVAGVAAAAAAPARSRSRPRRSFLSGPLAMVVVVIASFALLMKHKADSRAYAAQRRAGFPPHTVVYDTGGNAGVVAAPAETSLREELRRLANAIERAAHAGSSPTLQPVDDERVPRPPELPLYADELTRLVDASVASPIVLAQFEQYGYPIVLAAVEWLQAQDYEQQRTCCAAARVLQFLEQATAVKGFEVDPPLADPDDATSRRFTAAADGWRRVVERFAPDAKAYHALLLATGRLQPQPKPRDERKN